LFPLAEPAFTADPTKSSVCSEFVKFIGCDADSNTWEMEEGIQHPNAPTAVSRLHTLTIIRKGIKLRLFKALSVNDLRHLRSGRRSFVK